MGKNQKDIRPRKFIWKKDDLDFDQQPSVPKNLKSTIEGIPQAEDKAVSYLQRMVSSEKITIGEFRLILNVTQKKGPYKYE
jgi:predicted AAA+ superfamily ATPase